MTDEQIKGLGEAIRVALTSALCDAEEESAPGSTNESLIRIADAADEIAEKLNSILGVLRTLG